MAVMIPENPDFTFKESKEDLLFKALRDKLPNGYFVIYSFKNTQIVNNKIYDGETDFIIMHPDKGILCIEAKAAHRISYDSRQDAWFYSDGAGIQKQEMKNPFVQAQENCHKLYNTVRDKFGYDKTYKVLYAVWFHCISRAELDKEALPLYANKELILTEEALEQPEKYLEAIFNYEFGQRYSNWIYINNAYDILNDINKNYYKKQQAKFYIEAAEKGLVLFIDGIERPEQYLCGSERRSADSAAGEALKTDNNPQLYQDILNKVVVPQSGSVEVYDCRKLTHEAEERRFVRLYKEQAAVLDFLEGQTVVAVNGAAGSGKTLIAAEKAKRLAESGEKVLFLCYNRLLRDYLEKCNPDSNIGFFTIAGFDCHLRKQEKANADEFCSYLFDTYFENPDSFPYDHIIIDEGQDFGRNKKFLNKKFDYNDVFAHLLDIIKDKSSEHKSFYVFYDKLQMVQKSELPEFLKDPDCKITLPLNCRNTRSIAEAASAVIRLSDRPNFKFTEDASRGEEPVFHHNTTSDQIQSVIDRIIEKHLKEHKLESNRIVILSLKKDRESNRNDTNVSLFSEFCEIKDYNDGTGNYEMYYRYGDEKIRFTTCRKFKGLDADAVILIDIDGNTFRGDNNETDRSLYFVGATRARLYLDVVTSMKSKEWKELLSKLAKKGGKNK